MTVKGRIIAVATCLLLGLAGCGGSGGGGSSGGGDGSGGGGGPPSGGGQQAGGGLTVSVTAQDPFGAAVPDATIMLLYTSGTGFVETDVRTDSNGQATIDRAPDTTYAVVLAADALFGWKYDFTEPVQDRKNFDVILNPHAALSPGISRINVTDISADARQLTFSARLYLIESHAEEGEWYWGSIGVEDCVDCIVGPGAFTATYSGSSPANARVEPEPVADPLAIALLLDQGGNVAVSDPGDKRLLAARYLPTRLGAGDEMVLAAFAEDDAETGQAALLPNQPVTIFPVDNPTFTTDGQSYFPTIDTLATLEGGGSPFHEAVGEMVDFTAAAAPVESRSAVVVVTGSGASDCGGPAACGVARKALLDRSVSTGVPVVAVELADPSGEFDRHGLGPLAQSENGAVFWAGNADQLATILGRVPEVLDGRHTAIDVTIRLESPDAGAFASGNAVAGNLRIIACPWDCNLPVSVPFGLRVP